MHINITSGTCSPLVAQFCSCFCSAVLCKAVLVSRLLEKTLGCSINLGFDPEGSLASLARTPAPPAFLQGYVSRSTQRKSFCILPKLNNLEKPPVLDIPPSPPRSPPGPFPAAHPCFVSPASIWLCRVLPCRREAVLSRGVTETVCSRPCCSPFT